MSRLFVTTVVLLIFLANVNCTGEKPAADRGLAGYWKFDELTQNGETTPDASGSGHHGRVHGQALVEGVISRALKFEGYDQIVEVGDLRLKAPAAVAFRVKTSDIFTDRRLFSQLEGAENQAGALRFDGTRVEVWDGAEWRALISRKVKINKWMHISVVFEENGKTTGYLDGERQHIVRSGFDFDGVKAGIGAKFLGTVGNEFIGLMDDFRVYGRALGEDEIIGLYESR